MSKRSSALVAIALLGLGGAAPARADEAQAWTMFLMAGPVEGRFISWTEMQPRILLSEQGRLGQFLVRQALGIRLRDNVDIMFGFHWQENSADPDNLLRENRTYQHVAAHLFTTRSGIDLQGQARLEQRMFVGLPTTIWRSRVQLRLHLPLRGPGSIGPVLASETMFNHNSGNGRNRRGFEQQRSSIGLYVPLGNGFSLETGYLNQRLARIGTDRVVHVANIKLAYKLGQQHHEPGGHPQPAPAALPPAPPDQP